MYSELQLYHPHSCDAAYGSKYSLKKEKEEFETCQETFGASGFGRVKRKIMPFLEIVEEGIAAAHEHEENTIGDVLNPQNQQDDDDCEEMGLEENPTFAGRDPSEFLDETDIPTTGLFKKVVTNSEEELNKLTYKLDNEQRMAHDIGVNFAKQCVIARKTTIKIKAPCLIIQGGAGSGKSTVINVLAQRFEQILRKSGDDPEKPYIVKVAFTGIAASNIDGMTLNTAFNFKFGNEFLSLSDKIRDLKRTALENLVAVALDEFSMVKSDMFYQLDLRLRELKQRPDTPFGGCAVFLFGDILQLRPVKGRYIFEE